MQMFRIQIPFLPEQRAFKGRLLDFVAQSARYDRESGSPALVGFAFGSHEFNSITRIVK